VRALEARTAAASARAKPLFDKRGQLLPRERVTRLLDPGAPWLELSTMAGFGLDNPDPDKSIPGGGVINGIGFVSGVRCVINASDAGIDAGAIQHMGREKILRGQQIALENRLPYIQLIESAGANLLKYQVEGFVEGGRIFYNLARLSAAGLPVIAVVEDAAASGGYWLACAADEIVVDPGSIIGSIGVIAQGFGLPVVASRVGTFADEVPRLGGVTVPPEDPAALAQAIGYDERIGNKFLRNGVGFGGGCLPKDIRSLMARAEELGVGSAVAYLKEIDQVNLRRRQRVIDLLKQELGNLSQKKVLILGAAFKPDSDDVRDSPALDIALLAKQAGADVIVHDPIALPGVRLKHTELNAVDDLIDAFKEVDAIVLATEWQQYQDLDPQAVVLSVSKRLIIDGRNVLDVAKWQQAGFKVLALGRTIEEI
jgi:hypothetical protein